MHCEASTRTKRPSALIDQPLWICALIGVPIILFTNVAVAAELPELVFLLALVVYFLLFDRDKSIGFQRSSYQRLLASVSSLPLRWVLFCAVVCILLLTALLNEMPQIGITLLSATGYFVLNWIGRSQTWTGQRSAHFKRKLFPAMAAGSSKPLRTQGQVSQPVASLSVAAERHKPNQHSVEKRNGDCEPVQKLVQVSTVKPSSRSAKKNEKFGEVATAPLKKTLDREIEELVCSGLPNPADDDIVRQLVHIVRKSVTHLVPEAKVVGSAVGDLSLVQAQGVKPEVDVVVMASLDVLGERLKAFYLKGPQHNQKCLAALQPEMLQKTATRVFSERLPSLRFWRSQFTGPDPKIVLLAPATLGICNYPLRVNISVNNPYPLRLTSILSKCDVHSNGLIVLVMQWAQVRGLSNTAKGHLSPYAHSLLAMYFLKNGCDRYDKSITELFRDFVHFYSAWFDRHDVEISVRFSSGVAGVSTEKKQLPAENSLSGFPFIEDLFDASNNVAATVTAKGVMRLKEELARATCLLEGGMIATLDPLMERWTPPPPLDANVGTT